EVDVHRLGGGVVHAGHVIPLTRHHGRAAVTRHVDARRVGQLEADGARPAVDGRVQLEAVVARAAFGDDGGVVPREGGGVDPGGGRHAAGQLQGGGVAQADVGAGAVEGQRLAEFAGGGPGGAVERAGVARAGRVGHEAACALVEVVGGDQATREQIPL